MAIKGDAILIDVPAKAATYVMRQALDLSNRITPLFTDALLRGEIFPDVGNEGFIRVNILACNEEGSFKLHRFSIDANNRRVYTTKPTKNAYVDAASGVKLMRAVFAFIDSIDGKLPAISTVRFDLGVRRYLSAKYTAATREDNAYDLHICAYSNQIKDDYDFSSAQKLAGVLAIF